MKCPGCDQELTDNQACQTCPPEAQSIPPETNPQPGAIGADPSQAPPNGSASPPPDPATGVTQPTPSPADGQPEPGTRRAMIDLWKSQINAGGNVTLQNLIVEDKENKPEEEKSLQDFVKQLTSRKGRHYRPPEAELQKMVERLLDDRLILISSSFDEYALDTAWVVIETLRLSATRIEGQLTFENAAAAGVEFSLPKLCEQRPDTDGETVLLVQALHDLADTFPASILGNSARVGSARQDLKNCKLFVVVVVNHEYATRNNLSQQHNLPYRTFKYWNIPFLEPFFQSSFPDHYEQMLAAIAKQRSKWEADESAFTQQIRSYYANDRLRDVINSGGPHDPDTAAKSILESATPVEKTVLYAATFFNEITLPDFCRVVESLLGTRTMLKDAPNTNGNGTPAQVEVPLRSLWNEKKDDIFTDLLVETSTGSPRTVNLSEVNLAEPLRKLFEKRHRFYLLDQFNALLHTGIFFYPSLRLAQNTTQIAVDLAGLYPDEFNEGWIVYLVTRIREYFAAGATNENEDDDPMFRFLSSKQPGASNLAFARVSEVCQRFLGSPQQKSVVSNTLEHLMRTKYFLEVLWLIKQLKFNAEFDDWHWLRQLLRRADSKTRYVTYYYILSYLKQMGTGVYEGLRRIETWLPRDERSDYEFDTFVFRVLIEYCLDTIDRFKEKNYGKWPSRYPLFNVANAETASANCYLLAHWLLHPGVDRTLAKLKIVGTRITLLAILLAEWSFILLGTPPAPKTDESKTTESAPAGSEDFSASQLLDLLLNEFLTRLDLTERLELLKYWTHLESELFKASRHYSLSDKERQEASWKGALIHKLIGKLNAMPITKPLVKRLPAGSRPEDRHVSNNIA